MKLTDIERILLINQLEILSKLNTLSRLDTHDEKHYQNAITVLLDGYEIFYDNYLPPIENTMTEKESKFVLDVLEFYVAIESLKKDDKHKRLINHQLSSFQGFDLNHNPRHYCFCKFLIRDEEKFEPLAKYLKHRPRVPLNNLSLYEDMIYEYKLLLNDKYEGDSSRITEEDVLQIFDKTKKSTA